MYTSVAVVVTVTVSGTSAETIVCGQEKMSAIPMAIATTTASVSTTAPSARQERYTSSSRATTKMPKSGMTCFEDEEALASSHALSHGAPTRRMTLNAPPGAANGLAASS